MTAWRQTLAVAQRRVATQAIVAGAAAALPIAAGTALCWVAVATAMEWPVRWPLVGGFVAVVSASAAVVGLLRRPTPLSIATELDRHAGTHDAVSSALQLSAKTSPTPLEARAIADADTAAARINPSAAFPWRPKRQVILTVAAIAMLGGAAFIPDRWVMRSAAAVGLAGEKRPPRAQVQQALADASAAEQLIKAVQQPPSPTQQPGAAEAANTDRNDPLAELKEQLSRGELTPKEAAQQSATAVERAADKLEQHAADTQQAGDLLRERMALGHKDPAASPDPGKSESALTEALRDGDLQRAAEEAEKLAGGGPLSSEERARLADELKKVADDLKKPAPAQLPANSNPPPVGKPSTADPQPPHQEDRRQKQAEQEADRQAKELADKLDQAARELQEKEQQQTPATEKAAQGDKPSADKSDPRNADQNRGSQPGEQKPAADRSATEQSSGDKQPQGDKQGSKPSPNEKPNPGKDGERQPGDRPQQDGKRSETQGDKPDPSKSDKPSSGDAQKQQGQHDPQQQDKAGAERRPSGEQQRQKQSNESSQANNPKAGEKPGADGQNQPAHKPQPGEQPRASDKPQSDGRQHSGEQKSGEKPTQTDKPQGDRQQGQTQSGSSGEAQKDKAQDTKPAPDANRQHQPGGQPDRSQAPQPQSDRSGDKPDSSGEKTPDSQGPGKLPSMEQLREQLKKLADQPRNAAKDREDAQKLREQAQKMWENASPDRRKQMEELARQLAKSRSGKQPPNTGEQPGGSDRADKPDSQYGSGEQDSNAPGGRGPGSTPADPTRTATGPGGAPTATHDIDARSKGNEQAPSRIIAEWLTNKPAPRSGSTPAAPPADVAEAVRNAQKTAEQAVQQRTVPARLGPLVRRYFDRLPGAVGAQPASTPPAPSDSTKPEPVKSP